MLLESEAGWLIHVLMLPAGACCAVGLITLLRKVHGFTAILLPAVVGCTTVHATVHILVHDTAHTAVSQTHSACTAYCQTSGSPARQTRFPQRIVTL